MYRNLLYRPIKRVAPFSILYRNGRNPTCSSGTVQKNSHSNFFHLGLFVLLLHLPHDYMIFQYFISPPKHLWMIDTYSTLNPTFLLLLLSMAEVLLSVKYRWYTHIINPEVYYRT